MLIKTYFGYLSGVFAFGFYVGIILSIITKRSKPSKTTWIIWFITDLLILGSSYALGAKNTLWVPLVYTICGLVCLVLSLKHDAEKFSILDKTCLFISTAAWILWGLTNSALIAMFFGVIVNTLGAIPTWEKSYKDPNSQHPLPWLLVVFAGICQVISLEEYTLGLLLFPLDSLLVSFTTLFLTIRFNLFNSLKFNK